MSMNLVLNVVEGPDAGREIRLEEPGETVVGRDDPRSDADVRLDPRDRRASRRHFALVLGPSDCLLHDLGSANGTYVRPRGATRWGQRVGEAALHDGDEIKAGDSVLRVTLTPDVTVAVLDGAESSAGIARLQEASVAGSGGAASAWYCRECGSDVTADANADGRADELSGCAAYLCRICAGRKRTSPIGSVGGYLLLNELGRGGMGVVYTALHETTGRLAALKQALPLALTADGRGRFLRELSILHDLVDPYIVRFYDAGFCEDKPYFVSELCFGGDLDQFIAADGRPLLDPAAAVALVCGGLEGLQSMHARGFVHRDLKPANLLLRERGEQAAVKLADCGFARSFEEHGGTITREGEFAGTWMFMPFEQLRDFRGVRPVSDVYAMGTVLYYLLSGRFPLDFPTPWQVAAGLILAAKDPVATIRDDEPRSLAAVRPDLPATLAVVVDRATRKDPSERYRTALELRLALEGTHV